jgi:hypothetical protein
MLMRCIRALAVSSIALSCCSPIWAQGCVAAHTNQGVMSELCSGNDDHEHMQAMGSHWIKNRLTVNVGWRSFSSFRHFVGTNENKQRAVLGNQIKNHQNLYDIGLQYDLTRQWSILADLPVIEGTRNQLYAPRGVFNVAGIGDVTVGMQRWIFRPPTESGGNIALSASLKLPTGINDATGTAKLANGQLVKATADQSMQPGDGSWGFVLATQAYKPIWFKTELYFQGSWLFNPSDTNGVKTLRSQKGEGVMSVPDQYLWRGGFSHAVPKFRRMQLSLGGRMEGVPVRDAFGASNGFRRPGYIISLDPGLMLNYRNTVLSVNGPWALERNRKISVTDLANHTHGDAAFADYALIVGLSHRF